RDRPRLEQEAFAVGVRPGGGVDHLQGDDPAGADLPGLVDDPHAALAEDAEDLVAGNLRRRRGRAGGGAGEGGRRLGRRPAGGRFGGRFLAAHGCPLARRAGAKARADAPRTERGRSDVGRTLAPGSLPPEVSHWRAGLLLLLLAVLIDLLL